MNLDIKIPIGLLFTILGVLLTIFGLATLGETELYSRSLNININLWTGLAMVVIGVFMLSTAKYRKGQTK
jgi:membrane-bound ClpP family serine protease